MRKTIELEAKNKGFLVKTPRIPRGRMVSFDKMQIKTGMNENKRIENNKQLSGVEETNCTSPIY